MSSNGNLDHNSENHVLEKLCWLAVSATNRVG